MWLQEVIILGTCINVRHRPVDFNNLDPDFYLNAFFFFFFKTSNEKVMY